MKKMFEYDLVRRMFYHEGLSKREISRRTGYHRTTIDKMLLYPQPPGYRRVKTPLKPKLGLFTGIIDEILKSDRSAPRKQRHTVKRIFERLVEEYGFKGKYTIVKDYVRFRKTRMKEVFFPLEQNPGTCQIDFGQARVNLAGKMVTAHIFCMVLPFSDAIFVKAYPTEAYEAVQDGHVSAYGFFGGVAPHSLYDNMSTVVKKVLRDGQRDLTDAFLALRSHYLFRSRFCNVGRANEKGVVEGLVGYCRRNFFVPIPHFRNWDDLNEYLLDQCRRRFNSKVAGSNKTIGELFQEDRMAFLPLPAVPFEACRFEERRINSLSLVHFQSNNYSVPVRYAHQAVTVKAFVARVDICIKDSVIASHRRSYGRGEYIFDPIHYLPLLQYKPGALDGAMPFSGWELPECFDRLRRHMESRNGNAGKREYIQVLQLLRDYTIFEVRKAINKAFDCRALNFESIRMLTACGREPMFESVRLSAERVQKLPRVRVAMSNISQYRILVGGAS